ncbi:hypothetical protein QR680_000536 [Steinernema hermaphroditum]|uniref:Biotin carboxylation domain-containing protein n=1 Tax=Steinernema hermaphroditum TaxID=289476 RepID=A0AA39GUY0_9BILA|nr:hypothetical protein QR680_000536 [Steinernema hermaphroditum]
MVSEDFDLYNHACVETDEEGLRVLRKKNITYPVMIKAYKGGGGKEQISWQKAEVPGSPIFLMKCMVNARHIEVQLIGDEYGTVMPIFTRDCSIQRRCQKIIEKAPTDAVNLAVKVGYGTVSAGTVEYMYLPAEEKYYFLELNPRLQVEHPCAEMIRTDTEKCVIVVRIISEDPAEGFRPAFGNVESVQFQSNDEVWTYFSVSSPGMVQEYAALQFGHLFARGNSRRKAVSNLICALEELEVRATCTSQVSYLIGLLQDPKFEINNFHTGWLDERIAAKILTIIPTTDLADSWETELIYKKRKYDVLITWYSRIIFVVSKNGSEAHTGHYRVTIGKTLAIFGKGNEPSILCWRNTGKLLQYNVPDGARVRVRDAYAEMESMTMVLPLEVEKAGMLNDTDGSFSQASCVANVVEHFNATNIEAIHNFLFTENADTNYAALAKISETILSVQAHQIKRIDIGCSGEDHFVRMIYTSGAEGVAVVSAYHIVKGDVNYELIPCSNALHHCCTRSYAFESHTPILQSHAQKKRLIARNIGNIAKVVMQEGQIWYPDCAYKDDKLLSWEGFPLVILAEDSLEDLSGGQKDVFDMALKYGAEIVAALQAYVQSIVIYMPPFGELRGGAWAVLDPKINTTCIKMIADPQYRYSRTRIKYRAPQLEQLTSREDNEVQKLKRSLANSTNDQTNCAIQKQIVQRIEYLKPLYGPAAVRFADLHDRARRMLAKVSLYKYDQKQKKKPQWEKKLLKSSDEFDRELEKYMLKLKRSAITI